ncbi:At5g01610-like protein, partial [Dioscorea alata]
IYCRGVKALKASILQSLSYLLASISSQESIHIETHTMASQTIQSYRNGAEIYNGDAFCKKKSIQLLEEIGLPNGLFPLDDIEEFGYNHEAGFVWLIQKKKKDHTFKKIKRVVSYSPEVTAFVEKGKMKKMTGVKTKELMLWLSVVEMYIVDPASKKITFKTGTGLSDSFPVSAFELEE